MNSFDKVYPSGPSAPKKRCNIGLVRNLVNAYDSCETDSDRTNVAFALGVHIAGNHPELSSMAAGASMASLLDTFS